VIGASFQRDMILAISNLNTHNFLFIMAGLFLASVAKSEPATTGVLMQFPLYGAIASILKQTKNGAGLTVSDQISHMWCYPSNV
jgi:short-chain fatty acids transporter